MENNRNLYILKLNKEVNTIDLEKMLSESEENKNNIFKKTSILEQKTSLYALMAVKYIINSTYNIPFNKIVIKKEVLGKPYLENSSNIHFNISHSEDIIVIAFSNCQLGVDIEKLRKFNPKIVNRFFSKKEQEIFNNSRESFFEIWTRKEAYLKYLGVGLQKPLNQVCTFSNDLIDKFTTIKNDNYIINFFDNSINNVEIFELHEYEIERFINEHTSISSNNL